MTDDDNLFRYWTWEDAQAFLLDNGLMIATGTHGDDDAALTGKGYELYALLAAAVRLEERESA